MFKVEYKTGSLMNAKTKKNLFRDFLPHLIMIIETYTEPVYILK